MIKKMKFLNKRAQSTLEYAILIVIILAALLSIQVYLKRGIQGRFKSSTDDIGDQFSPGNTNYISRTTTSSKQRQTFSAGESTQALLEPETTDTEMTSSILNVEKENWGNDE